MEKRRKGPEKLFEEIIVENFPSMGKEIVNQVNKAQRVPGRINPRRNTTRHIVIKLTEFKDKDKILKATGEKQQISYKGIPISITAYLSIEIIQARRKWQDILKVMKENNLQPRLLYQAKDLIQIRRRNKKLYRQAKAERIQHHQTSSPANAKGSSLDRKHRKGV